MNSVVVFNHEGQILFDGQIVSIEQDGFGSDLVIRPYNREVNGKTGIEDVFADKYAELEGPDERPF